jgi:hypothetical protein
MTTSQFNAFVATAIIAFALGFAAAIVTSSADVGATIHEGADEHVVPPAAISPPEYAAVDDFLDTLGDNRSTVFRGSTRIETGCIRTIALHLIASFMSIGDFHHFSYAWTKRLRRGSGERFFASAQPFALSNRSFGA